MDGCVGSRLAGWVVDRWMDEWMGWVSRWIDDG